MELRTVVTASSVWKFDVIEHRYIRFPRNEAPNPDTVIPYTLHWEPYLYLERTGNRLVVHRPVPFGEGALRMTGEIETDDLTDTDLTAAQPLQ